MKRVDRHHVVNLVDAKTVAADGSYTSSRGLTQLSGEIRTTGGVVEVTLDPPDTPIHRRALAGLVDDLNGLGATFPGTDVPVRYQVAVHRSEVAA
jgi:hypothetical protein